MRSHLDDVAASGSRADALDRAERRIAQLEALLIQRGREAAQTAEALRAATHSLREIYRAMPGALLLVDRDGTIQDLNDAACALLGYRADQLLGRAVGTIVDGVDEAGWAAVAAAGAVRVERTFRDRAGAAIPVLFSATRLPPVGADLRAGSTVCVAVDLREQKQLQRDLQLAQKLESLGRLAAGVAHEINTPVQFIMDSVTFARDVAGKVTEVLALHRELHQRARSGAVSAVEVADRAQAAGEEADLDYALANLPDALDQALEGLSAVAGIVRSLRTYTRPDVDHMTPADLNEVVISTLRLARNEYKDIAEVELHLGELPLVTCHAGSIGQALLNLIVNGAHAIRDRMGADGRRGTISVRTSRRGAHAVIAVADDGTGIPEAIRARIFDVFFTTKGAGGGTGQGLAIARAVARDRHGGDLTFVTSPGRGTTFELTLPIDGRAAQAPEREADGVSRR